MYGMEHLSAELANLAIRMQDNETMMRALHREGLARDRDKIITLDPNKVTRPMVDALSKRVDEQSAIIASQAQVLEGYAATLKAFQGTLECVVSDLVDFTLKVDEVTAQLSE